MNDLMNSFLAKFNQGKHKQVGDLATLSTDTAFIWATYKTRSLERLPDFPKLTHLCLWSADEATLEKVAQLKTLEFLVLAGNITKLPKKFNLPKLHSLALMSIPRLASLEGLPSLAGLRSLAITGGKILTDYRPVGELKRLEKLELGREQHYDRPNVDSLKWIGALTKLQDVFISFNKVNDDSGREFAKLKNLKKLFISGGLLPRPTFAYLAGKLSQLQSKCLMSYSTMEGSLCLCPKCKQVNLVIMTGKGCGMLCPKCKEAKFNKLHSEFMTQMEQAKAARN